ncbi:MAG: DUF362 domain-containing protein [Nitrospirales bacterium]
MPEPNSHSGEPELTRRQLLKITLAGSALATSGLALANWIEKPTLHAHTFIGKANSYTSNLVSILLGGFQQLGVTPQEIKEKRILLKPNLVETRQDAPHINTHPLLIQATIEAFLYLGAKSVIVGEGPGHRRDALQILEEAGLANVLYEDRIPFVSLNDMTGFSRPNAGRQTHLDSLIFPDIFQEIDWVVSMAKLKTHHWAGVTLSMKNLFGTLPGLYYGWPKNVLHHAGIHESILDITATLRPHFSIIDGIIGMEGDGPIMGTPKHAGVLVMGRDLPAVDATGARLMGINPHKIPYLHRASNWLGAINELTIKQVGESIATVRQNFELLDHIEAHRGIRLS